MVYFNIEFGFGSRKEHQRKVASKCEIDGWDFVNGEVERLRTEGRFKTASNYLTAAQSWSDFTSCMKWSFTDMTACKVEQFQRWLSEKGICLNTISAYMRALRAMFRRAMPNENECRSFDKVFTGRAKTRKRSITEKEIQQLYQLPLAEGTFLSLSRDIFMFSFYAMGMPFVDIAYLKKSQVKTDTIHYARHKTGQPIQVVILPPMRQIMERYGHQDSEYVFPILPNRPSDGSRDNAESLHKSYRNELRRYNYSLHKLAQMMGLPHPLSSYVVRHSWASIAYQHHVDVDLISKALGHTKTSTTLLYIKSLFDPDLADANHALMEDLGFCSPNNS